MNTNWIRRIKKLTALGLCLCICMGLFCGCGADADMPSATAPFVHTISVQNQGGTALTGATVKVYSDKALTNFVSAGKTDGEGKFTFSDDLAGMEEAVYYAAVSGVASGYALEGSYPVYPDKDTVTTIVPGIRAMTDDDLLNATLRLGDPMMDFTVTGGDGTVYTLSEMLKEKKAVVLNFWYLKCDPCKMEFPFVQQAYEKYSDELALLAMNPVDGDNAEIDAFRQTNGYTFPMLACDPAWANMMRISSYPTTVVIDRYSSIVLVHRGMVEDSAGLERIFEYVTSEDYEQQFFKSMSQVPSV